MNFGNILKELRSNCGLTQLQLAGILDISKSNISKYEAGSVEPNMDTLIRIANYFNVSIDYLMGREDDLVPQSKNNVDVKSSNSTLDEPREKSNFFFFFFDNQLREVFKLRFKKSLEDKGMNIQDFSDMTEIDLKKCESYLDGLVEPSLEDLIQMSHALEVSTDYLLGLSPKLSYYENKVLGPFVKLNRDNKDIVIGKAKDLLREQELGESVAAEEPMRKAVGK